MSPPTTRDLQIAFAIHNAGIARSARECADHPIAFATDPLCETCQEGPRDGTSRKCYRCRHVARLESKRRYDRKNAAERAGGAA